ncbi:MAG: hypothetical protein R2867_26535 [Caldilineaceae bacterium]
MKRSITQHYAMHDAGIHIWLCLNTEVSVQTTGAVLIATTV